MRYQLNHRDVLKRFGTLSEASRLLGKPKSTVASWLQTNCIPARHHPELLELAARQGIPLTPADFVTDTAAQPATAEAA